MRSWRLLYASQKINHIYALLLSRAFIDLPRTIEMGNKVSMVHRGTSLAVVAIAGAERERIHFVNSVETMTEIGLGAVAVAAAAVGNLSNSDSLEFHKKRKRYY